MIHVEVTGLTKRYGATQAFENIDFTLRSGEFVTLLGPSGCGKSTLLRCLAGLTRVDAGRLRIHGEDLTHTAPQQRGIGMVFQSYALFPNMTVQDNIAFGLKMQRLDVHDIERRVTEAIRLVELTGREGQYPHALSGGQRQRVALARALVVAPKILLLDEPLSALDARIRASLREQIRVIQQRLGLTTLFVTHDQEEALTLSDRVFVMNQGRIVQEGCPETVYTRPASEFAARFWAHNLLSGAEAHRLFGFNTPGALAIRPESIRVLDATAPDADALDATILHHQLLGNIVRYQVESRGVTLLADHLNRSANDLLPRGAAVKLLIARDEICKVR